MLAVRRCSAILVQTTGAVLDATTCDKAVRLPDNSYFALGADNQER